MKVENPSQKDLVLRIAEQLACCLVRIDQLLRLVVDNQNAVDDAVADRVQRLAVRGIDVIRWRKRGRCDVDLLLVIP
jgi:hypothetical protein